ncbi:MAG: pseudouridine synthase [Pseudomonadota bacterium]|nr:pseudouridine synthase [Pseudomonadota bacterium]
MSSSFRPRRRRNRTPLTVLAEGADWIVVAKPPSLLVHRSEMLPGAEAALQVVRDQVGRHVYPIHRLDRPASGCLLFATTQEWAGPLSAAMASADAQKTYLAFVRGYFKEDGPLTVDRPMKDDNGNLREATSTVWCLGRSHEPRCSLLRVQPRTGRYHQVRRHVRDLMHPIIGDTDHGDSKVNRWWRDNGGATRLGLHCASLSIPLPDGSRIEAVSPLFEDHFAVWSAQPWWADAVAAFPSLALPPLPLRDPAGAGPLASRAPDDATSDAMDEHDMVDDDDPPMDPNLPED